MNTRAVANQESSLRIWTNPTGSEFDSLRDVVRFTAVFTIRKVYVWDYSLACHTDVSTHLQLEDTYDSPYFLKGAAVRQADGRFTMFQSHYLESFKRSRLTREERLILESLLDEDWSWVNQYVEVTTWLKAFRMRLSL